MSRFRLGLHTFAEDMRESVPLRWTFVLTILAFLVAFAMFTGFRV